MKSNDVEVCSRCRRSVKVRFRDVCFWFHWVGDVYCIDVLLVFEDSVIGLLRETWVLDREHAREQVRPKAHNL